MRISVLILAGLLGLGGFVLVMADGTSNRLALCRTVTAVPGEDGREGETLQTDRGTRDVDALTTPGAAARILQCGWGKATRATCFSGPRIAGLCGGTQSPPAPFSAGPEFSRGIDSTLLAHGTRLQI